MSKEDRRVSSLGSRTEFLKRKGISKYKADDFRVKLTNDAMADGFQIIMAIRTRKAFVQACKEYYDAVAEEYSIDAKTADGRSRRYYLSQAREAMAISHIKDVEMRKLTSIEEDFRQSVWDVLKETYDQDYCGVFIDLYLYHRPLKKISEARNIPVERLKEMIETLREETLYEPRHA